MHSFYRDVSVILIFFNQTDLIKQICFCQDFLIPHRRRLLPNNNVLTYANTMQKKCFNFYNRLKDAIKNFGKPWILISFICAAYMISYGLEADLRSITRSTSSPSSPKWKIKNDSWIFKFLAFLWNGSKTTDLLNL